MKILLLGANGMIGQALQQTFKHTDNICISSRTHGWVLDMTNLPPKAELKQQLSGIDCIINTIGLAPGLPEQAHNALYHGLKDFFQTVFDVKPITIINISAFSNHTHPERVPYLSYKYRLDQYLMQHASKAIILRPSLIYAPQGLSTQLFTKLAALPIVFLAKRGQQPIAALHIDDLTQLIHTLIHTFIHKQPTSRVLNVGGASCDVATYLTLLARPRSLTILPLPNTLMRAAIMGLGYLTPALGGQASYQLVMAGSNPNNHHFEHWMQRPPLRPEHFTQLKERTP